jgi:rSAM/selenodomain-associated transferase 1
MAAARGDTPISLRPEHLIVFTRYPEPGRTKTRMIPVLGASGAAALQRRMTEHLMAAVRGLAMRRPVSVEIRFEGGSTDRMRRWLGGEWAYRPQGPGHIGRRMDRALARCFDDGADRALLIGSDVPGIDAVLLGEAFDRLGDHDVVLGPAADGGYYLVGAGRSGYGNLRGLLFRAIPWGTDRVFETTLSRLASGGAALHRLPVLRDVDRPEDLPVWREADR